MTPADTALPLVAIERGEAPHGPRMDGRTQAAYYTSFRVATIRRVCRLGELQHVRIGHRNGPIRTRAEWLDAWIMRGVQEPVVH